MTTTSLSLDGATAATHDAVRGIAGHFDATVEAIARLKGHGFTVQVNTTVMGPNLEELADVAATIHDLGADIWEVFFLIATGRGTDVAETSAIQNEDVCEFLVGASRYGMTVRTVEAPFFRRVALARRSAPPGGGTLYRRLRTRLVDRLGEPTLPVRAPSAATRDGKGVVFVAANGDVFPSGFMPLKLGNVREQRLVDVYRDHPLLRAIRAAEFAGPCGRCARRALRRLEGPGPGRHRGPARVGPRVPARRSGPRRRGARPGAVPTARPGLSRPGRPVPVARVRSRDQGSIRGMGRPVMPGTWRDRGGGSQARNRTGRATGPRTTRDGA